MKWLTQQEMLVLMVVLGLLLLGWIVQYQRTPRPVPVPVRPETASLPPKP